ncbi:four helix bundle protein [Elizabethkingia anophelis subsp. anophelis]|uniref:four helix bundle protein n=1 Tax=Elizabethkingia anophelis TaxID=1117645 RepID=UPI00314007C2
MSENSIIGQKSFKFAICIVNFYKKFTAEKKEFIISKQIMRSGTSIGANVREALNGQSKADFIHKLSIAQKECDETIYWLELLKATDYIEESEFINLHSGALELLKIIRSIIITSKKNL